MTNDVLNILREPIETAMREFHVPGLAIAVVDGNGIIASEDFGLRDVALGLPATPRTVFAIGSCTKAFTAFGLGLLVDEGRLTWDTRVRDVVPGFALCDEVAGQRATVRDLLCHRTGLPRHDLAWYKSPNSRGELMARARHLEPSADFRAKYQYQNIMFMLAGHVVESVTGQSWESFTQRRILDPLGMSQTFFATGHARERAELALPYQDLDSEARLIPFYAEGPTALGPAGHIQSCALDMAKWLVAHLNGGQVSGAALIKPDTLNEILSPQVAVVDPTAFTSGAEEFGWANYGLGWRLLSYRGRRLAQHNGAIDGFGSHASFLPEAGLGVVALSNLNGSNVPAIVAYHLYDALLGLEPVNWTARLQDRTRADKSKAEGERRARDEARRRGTTASRPLSAFVGTYTNPGYGSIVVTLRDGALSLTFNTLDWTMSHYHFDVFEMSHEHFDEPKLVAFQADESGEIAAAHIKLEPNAPAIVFTATGSDRRASAS